MSTSAQTIGALYTSGDVLINNPVEWCVIFVSVILVSACIQYSLHLLDIKVTNKYARMMSRTSQQEVTVIGIVAVLLMIATSVLPTGDSQLLYSALFSWTNMLVFFVSFLYVIEVVIIYVMCTFDMQLWKTYEDGRLDTDDPDQLVLRQRHYRLAYNRFEDELLLAFQIRPRQCPFHENCSVFHKRFLAKLADLSFRCWLSLSVVSLANFGRAMLSPWGLATDQKSAFLNALLYLACTGWLLLLLFGIFAFWLFRSMSQLVNKELKRSTVGAEIVPLFDPLRAIESIQALLLGMNYYATVFALGIASTVSGTGYTICIAIVFAIPLIVVMLAMPWVLWALSIMSVLGSVKTNRVIVMKIVRQNKGDYLDDSDEGGSEAYSDLDEDRPQSKDPVMAKLEKGMQRKPGARVGGGNGFQANRPLFSNEERRSRGGAERPSWIEDDERWDGQNVTIGVNDVVVMSEKNDENDERRMDYLFYANVDGDEFDMTVRRVAPELAPPDERPGGVIASRGSGDARSVIDDPIRPSKSSDGRGRPIWLESDEELDM